MCIQIIPCSRNHMHIRIWFHFIGCLAGWQSACSIMMSTTWWVTFMYVSVSSAAGWARSYFLVCKVSSLFFMTGNYVFVRPKRLLLTSCLVCVWCYRFYAYYVVIHFMHFEAIYYVCCVNIHSSLMFANFTPIVFGSILCLLLL